MDLSYSPKYEAFRREVRDFLEKNRDRASSDSIVLRVGQKSPKTLEWQRILIENGYAARTIPREYGGYGAEPDLLERVIIDEEFNKAAVSRGIGGQGPDMLVPTLLEHGSEEQKRRWVGATIRGEVVWCQGYSEPNAGSDLANVQTRAVEEGDDFIINGQKIWTTTAHLSEMMFALVRTEPDASKHAGLSYLLIPMDTPGIEVRPLETMTGQAEFNEVFFTDVRVPQANVVGKRGQGWKIANTTLKHPGPGGGDAPGDLERCTIHRRPGIPGPPSAPPGPLAVDAVPQPAHADLRAPGGVARRGGPGHQAHRLRAEPSDRRTGNRRPG
jgi:alkylation response protein AidB-like acyl-CoA dehydrogenase